MSQRFQMTSAMRRGNALLKFLLQVGVSIASLRLLEHRGRRSGKVYVTPVALVERKDGRWLVAAFGEVNWVHNIRAAGSVTLRRGTQTETVAFQELDAQAASPVLREFLKQYGFVPFMRPYFNTTAASSLADFEQEAARHPVFRLEQC